MKYITGATPLDEWQSATVTIGGFYTAANGSICRKRKETENGLTECRTFVVSKVTQSVFDLMSHSKR
jgi:hypothetical protein